MFEKIASPKDYNRLPRVYITGESITNTNNFMNIRKNYKSFWTCLLGPGEVFLKKKTGDEKSRDTVPLKVTVMYRGRVLLCTEVYICKHVHTVPKKGPYFGDAYANFGQTGWFGSFLPEANEKKIKIQCWNKLGY
jgi:hypothetical protein